MSIDNVLVSSVSLAVNALLFEALPIYLPLALYIVPFVAPIVNSAASVALVAVIEPSDIVTAIVLPDASSVVKPPLKARPPVSYTIRY